MNFVWFSIIAAKFIALLQNEILQRQFINNREKMFFLSLEHVLLAELGSYASFHEIGSSSIVLGKFFFILK